MKLKSKQVGFARDTRRFRVVNGSHLLVLESYKVFQRTAYSTSSDCSVRLSL
jgi:hypothetical protein